MKQYAVIGAGSFGKRILEELILLECEIVLIDKDPEIIEYFKNNVTAAYIANVINEEIVKKLIPADIDAVIVDLGDKIETSILLTQYLKKMGVLSIIVKAETDQHGEILSIIGADHVVFPHIEAAKRLLPLLVSELIFNYLPLPGGLILAECGFPKAMIGHTFLELNLRKQHGINIVAIRRSGQGDYQVFNPEYKFQERDMILIIGRENDVFSFSGRMITEKKRRVNTLFKWFLGNR